MFDMSFAKCGYSYSTINLFRIRDIGKRINESNFDFDVYLPTYGVNLQREFVWTPEQQSAFMESIVYYLHRNIPNIAVVIDDQEANPICRIVDGKQRITTVFNWLNGKVTLSVPGFTGTIEDCPNELRKWIGQFSFKAYSAYDGRKKKVDPDDVDDRDIVRWFNLINFAGTPQDQSHKEMLTKLLDQ